jgi:hypothetical protein
MRSGTCYVLSGRCVHRFAEEILLEAGTWALVDGGDYELEVVGDEEAVVVLVWKLPFRVEADE